MIVGGASVAVSDLRIRRRDTIGEAVWVVAGEVCGRGGREEPDTSSLDGGEPMDRDGTSRTSWQHGGWAWAGASWSRARRFPFPFPFDPLGSGKWNGKLSALELIAGGGFYDAAVSDQRCERLTDIAGAHAHGVAHLLLRERGCGVGEQEFDAL
jgi:hypothetical protein